MLYALGRRGVEVLDVPVRKGVGERYVAHQLMIGNVRIALTLASRERGIVCVWRSFPGGDAFPIRPDGFFSFQFPELPEGRNRAFFFLEADRSTMPRERFVEKLRRYEAWHAGGAHTAVLGIRSFRVLTVTKSPERLASLLAAVAAEARIERRRGYWFTGEADLLGGMAGRVFERVWQQPGSPGPRESLLPGCFGSAALTTCWRRSSHCAPYAGRSPDQPQTSTEEPKEGG